MGREDMGIRTVFVNERATSRQLRKARLVVLEGADEGRTFEVTKSKTYAGRASVNDFILKATILSAVDVPEVNAAFDFDSIIQYKSVNLAVAIAIPEGLVTPVIKNAQDKTLLEISKSVKDLAGRAKNKKLSPDEFSGGTITVSNLGAYGVDFFDAIINPPQASILSIGAVKPQFVPNEEGDPVLQQRMWVGMSCDHRVIDGAIGATYLQAFRKYIENPASMLL